MLASFSLSLDYRIPARSLSLSLSLQRSTSASHRCTCYFSISVACLELSNLLGNYMIASLVIRTLNFSLFQYDSKVVPSERAHYLGEGFHD